MKRIFEWIAGFALIAFSFYFTDRVTLLVANKSDLMSEIKAVSSEYKIEAVDAIIDKSANTIIPGKYGREVDNNESYLSMHEFGVFNDNYLVYKKIKPNTSLEDNKDKFITKGRTNRDISLIVNDNSDISDYLSSNNYKYNIIVNEKSSVCDKNECINGSDKNNFKEVDKTLNNKICIKDYSNMDLCLKHKYYIIAPMQVLSSSNVFQIKNTLSGGDMILITKSAKLDDLKLLLKEIKFKDLNVVYVSELINEK